MSFEDTMSFGDTILIGVGLWDAIECVHLQCGTK
jgi:hypothetical protein